MFLFLPCFWRARQWGWGWMRHMGMKIVQVEVHRVKRCANSKELQRDNRAEPAWLSKSQDTENKGIQEKSLLRDAMTEQYIWLITYNNTGMLERWAGRSNELTEAKSKIVSRRHKIKCAVGSLSQWNYNLIQNAFARDPLHYLCIIHQYHTDHRKPEWEIQVMWQRSKHFANNCCWDYNPILKKSVATNLSDKLEYQTVCR